jgi:hypothetical protein
MNTRKGLMLGLAFIAAGAISSYSAAEPNRGGNSEQPARPPEGNGQNRPSARPSGGSEQDTLKQALGDLESAKAKLANVTKDPDGHREKAKSAIDTAIAETRAAIASAEQGNKSNRGGADKRRPGEGSGSGKPNQ